MELKKWFASEVFIALKDDGTGFNYRRQIGPVLAGRSLVRTTGTHFVFPGSVSLREAGRRNPDKGLTWSQSITEQVPRGTSTRDSCDCDGDRFVHARVSRPICSESEENKSPLPDKTPDDSSVTLNRALIVLGLMTLLALALAIWMAGPVSGLDSNWIYN